MKRFLLISIITLFCGISVFAQNTDKMEMKEKSLYARRGGYDALVATIEKFKVPEKEKREVLDAVGGLKKDIVEKK